MKNEEIKKVREHMENLKHQIDEVLDLLHERKGNSASAENGKKGGRPRKIYQYEVTVMMFKDHPVEIKVERAEGGISLAEAAEKVKKEMDVMMMVKLQHQKYAIDEYDQKSGSFKLGKNDYSIESAILNHAKVTFYRYRDMMKPQRISKY